MNTPILAIVGATATGKTRLALALAQALDRFLALSAEERDHMAQDGMEFVRAKFSKENMCARTLDVYREVLGLAAASQAE